MPRSSRSAQLDAEAVREACDWINALVDDAALEPDSFAAGLKSGASLCKLINAIKPATIKKISTSALKFSQMDNITAFLRAAKALGVPERDLFDTIDLHEEKDLVAVVQTVHALGRTVQTAMPDSALPVLGPRLATANRRSFTEAQLRAGLNEMTFQTKGADIERLAVDESASITFGNAKSGAGDATVASKQTAGATIERLAVDESMSITFGNAKSGAGDATVASKQTAGATIERLAVDESASITFGSDRGERRPPPAPPRPGSMGASAGS